jgi:hypothetical protein
MSEYKVKPRSAKLPLNTAKLRRVGDLDCILEHSQTSSYLSNPITKVNFFVTIDTFDLTIEFKYFIKSLSIVTDPIVFQGCNDATQSQYIYLHQAHFLMNQSVVTHHQSKVQHLIRTIFFFAEQLDHRID